MRRSIEACSFRRVAFSGRRSWPICAAAGSCAGQAFNDCRADVWGNFAAIAAHSPAGRQEGDLRSDARNSHIATQVERSSRFVMLVKVDGKANDGVVGAQRSRHSGRASSKRFFCRRPKACRSEEASEAGRHTALPDKGRHRRLLPKIRDHQLGCEGKPGASRQRSNLDQGRRSLPLFAEWRVVLAG